MDCLRSIYDTTKGIDIEVYTVINASLDDSAAAIQQHFPQVNLVINEEKMGFTYNHNMIMKKARGEYILVLNDDTIILDGALRKMVDFMDASPRVGVLGCRILNPDRTLQWSCGRSMNHRFEYFKSGIIRPIVPFLPTHHYERIESVSWVTGACLLVRSKAVHQVGLLDENIVIYYEDADWCYRMIQAGWEVVFYPDASIIHYYGQTRKHNLTRDVFIIYQSRFYFFSKHYGPLSYHLVKAFTLAEIAFRYLKTLLSSKNTEHKMKRRTELIDAYTRAFKLAFSDTRLRNLHRKRQVSSH